ncbi:hypothetical protein ACLBWT_08360 [Paenibacillus sp. D51F]
MGTAYTGIAEPFQLGAFGVEANARILQRLRFVHERLLFIGAAQLPARRDWDLKAAMGRHVYEDAEAADGLRDRIRQLRKPAPAVGHEPDPSLALMMEELLHAQSDCEWLAGSYGTVRKALADACRSHMKRTQSIVDQPTIRLLRGMLLDLDLQLDWAAQEQERLQDAGEWDQEAADSFSSRLRSYLKAAGGISGEGPRASQLPQRFRSADAYQLPRKSVRHSSSGGTVLYRSGMGEPSGDPLRERLIGMMRVRQEEMTAAELIAAVIWSQKGMPWDFYRDLARHLWDEVRHALFGQAALEAEGLDWHSRPQYTADYDVNIAKLPGSQYAWLSIGIEEGAMKRPGKAGEYEFCRNEARHPLMMQFQDYDWADEVTHAAFGRTWTPELFGEDLAFIREVAAHELHHFFAAVSKAETEASAGDAGVSQETSPSVKKQD